MERAGPRLKADNSGTSGASTGTVQATDGRMNVKDKIDINPHNNIGMKVQQAQNKHGKHATVPQHKHGKHATDHATILQHS